MWFTSPTLKERTRLPGLDGLRGVAALGVVVCHLAGSVRGDYRSVAAGAPLVDRLLDYGSRGVDVFFVLSGFLLTLPYVTAMLTGRPLPGSGRYVVNRLVRIIPGFWAALTFFYLATHSLYHGPRLAAINYLFLQNFTSEATGTGLAVAWTLGYEIQFYLALPLLALGAERLVRRFGRDTASTAWTLAIALAASLVANELLRLGLSEFGFISSASLLPTYYPRFAVGMAVALLFGYSRQLPAWRSPSRLTLYAVAGIMWYGDFAAGGSPLLELLWPAVLVAAAVLPPEGEKQLLSHPVLRWFGLVSYSLYLFHDPVLEKIGASHLWLGPSPLFLPVNLAAGIGISTAFAAAGYYLVEAPALRLKDRLTTKKGLPQGEALHKVVVA